MIRVRDLVPTFISISRANTWLEMQRAQKRRCQPPHGVNQIAPEIIRQAESADTSSHQTATSATESFSVYRLATNERNPRVCGLVSQSLWQRRMHQILDSASSPSILSATIRFGATTKVRWRPSNPDSAQPERKRCCASHSIGRRARSFKRSAERVTACCPAQIASMTFGASNPSGAVCRSGPLA
jgi:hypothetical protein